jgi:hypothetical protein
MAARPAMVATSFASVPPLLASEDASGASAGSKCTSQLIYDDVRYYASLGRGGMQCRRGV